MIWRRLSTILLWAGLLAFAVGMGSTALAHWQTGQALKKAREMVSAPAMEKEARPRRHEGGAAAPHDSTAAAEAPAPVPLIFPDYEPGDVMGILHIPKLNIELPIISGTEEPQLSRGVGHHRSTWLPGQENQILLSGHRETVFRRLGELVHGDHIEIRMEHGVFTYEIFDTEIVSGDDRTVIGPTDPDEILVLSTCYPFTFIGSAPDRYVLYAR